MKKRFINWLAILLFTPLVGTAGAASVPINTWITGENNGDALVATLDINQDGSNVDFKITNSVGNLGSAANASTFISQLFFNYDNDSDPLSTPRFTDVVGTGVTVTASDFDLTPSGFGESYSFSLEFDLPPPGATRFEDGEMITWTITDALVSEFLVTSSGTGDPAYAGVHIQSLASGDSTKYIGTELGGPPAVIPIPAAAPLFASALGLFGYAGWRKRKGHASGA